MINGNGIRFSTIFKLNSSHRNQKYLLRMKRPYQKVLDVLNAIQTKKSSNIERISRNDAHDDTYDVYWALKWMLETGYIDDGLSSRYDEVLDAVAALLIKKYKDTTILPTIADMIFNRYKKGQYIYDLVWAFFECRDPGSLIYIACRLSSPNIKDAEIACRLLSFVPNVNMQNVNRYDSFLNWFDENNKFLYYTEESFQQMNNPRIYAVSLEAKYLCTPVSPICGEIHQQLTNLEKQNLSAFNKLDSNTKLLLADYSFLLFKQNNYWWNMWTQYPTHKQIRIMYAAKGGIS